MNKKQKGLLLAVIILFAVFCVGGLALGLKEVLDMQKISYHPSDKNPPAAPLPTPSTPPTQPEYVDVTIASIGDILIHNTVYYAAYEPSTKTYDFTNQFQHVKPLLADADVTIANLETTLAGAEKGYTSYPQFNTPDSIIDTLKDSGVDILTSANNHRMDTGVSGFYRTIEVVRQKGLEIIGGKAKKQEKTYVIKDIQGVKVAFLNFGYAYPRWDGSLNINGLILPKDMAGLLDTFNPEELEKSTEGIKERINSAKAEGADLIILFMHWGDEYHRLPNDFQKKLAANLTSLGVDAIFGGHPHVLQPAVYLTSPEGEKVPVFYSQGNFISDQRKETVDDVYTEQGIIAKVTFRVQKNRRLNQNSQTDENHSTNGAVKVLNASAVPTWVNKKTINNKYFYEVIPAEDALKSPEKFPNLNAGDLERIKFCRDTVEELAKGLK